MLPTKQAVFRQFTVEFNPETRHGWYKHAFIEPLSGTFDVIDLAGATPDKFFQWELDNWDGLCYIPDEVAAVLTSFQIVVPTIATL